MDDLWKSINWPEAVQLRQVEYILVVVELPIIVFWEEIKEHISINYE